MFLAAQAVGAEELPTGRVVEKIVCREKPEQSYALYLPSSYSAEKRWPVLCALDARGRALVPIERFREAAEEYGWILVSSYNSRSDSKEDPNTPAMQAMWNDTHARLAIDDRRVTLTGFSGGARAATYLAFRAPKAIAGVIGCGAGFAEEKAPVAGLPFLYFATIGNRDFNYYELRALDERLAAANAPHRVEIFDGGHDWLPTPIAREAIAWMELQQMKTGTRSRDDALIEALYRRDLERARALEASGNEAEAAVRYAQIAEDYHGLADIAAPSEKAATLERSASVRKSREQARARDKRDRRAIVGLVQKLEAAAHAPELPLAGTVAADLGIASLKKRASAADSPEERFSAERVLANLRALTSFYLPEQLLDQGDYARARMVLAVAVEIDPEDPRVYYNLAGADARAGERRRALKELQRAVDKGFQRFEYFDEDPDFAKLRGDSEFQKWLAMARASAVPSASPTPAP